MSHDEQLLIAGRAAEWVARMQSGSAQDKREFLQWLRRSPENVGEVLLAASTDVMLRQLMRTGAIDAGQFKSSAVADFTSRVSSDPRRAVQPHRWRWIAALTGCAAAAAFAAFFMMQRSQLESYETATGEQRAVELADGSAVFINAQSNIRVKFSRQARDVYLEAGQAMFTAAKDAARPFQVHVGDNVIRAIGTKFDVEKRSNSIRIAVIEGAVQVSDDHSRSRRVTSGEAVGIQRGHVSMVEPIDITTVSAWQQRRLIFSDSTLSEISEAFSRYNRTPRIRIESDVLRERRISGVFDADSPEALLIYLSSDRTIAFERHENEIVIRAR